MPNFQEYQMQMQAQMSGGPDSREGAEAARQMADAAKNMQQSAQSGLQSNQQINQSLQSTNSQISMLVQSMGQLTNEIRASSLMSGTAVPTNMGNSYTSAPIIGAGGGGGDATSMSMSSTVLSGTSSPPAPIAPVIQGTSINWRSQASAGIGIATGIASNLGMEAVQRGTNAVGHVRSTFARNELGLIGAQPGFVHAPDTGLIRGTYQSTGMGWDSTRSQNYSFGAYQRSMGAAGGQSAGNWAQAGMNMGIQNFASGQGLGTMLGAMGGTALASSVPIIGPLLSQLVGAPLGAMVGQKVGKTLDFFNPLAIGMNEASRGSALASGANNMSHTFLRGREGIHGGDFSISERGDISKGLRKMTLEDMTFDTNDVLEMQQLAQQGGRFAGVQNAEQYVERFRQVFDNSKMIMKSFQMSAKEASEMMDDMFNEIGLDHGRQMSRFSGSIYAGANLTGMNPQQMMQIATQGARAGAGAGLMGTTGANMALQSHMLASSAVSKGNISRDLLATVGGERGLGDMMQGSQMQFAQGIGGIMASGAGQGYSSLSQGMQQFVGATSTNEGMMDFLANRHRKTQDLERSMGADGMQMQEFNHYAGIARRMGLGRDGLKKLIAGRFGGDTAKAEAWMNAMESMPEQMRERQLSQARQRSDMNLDSIQERYSIRGRIKYGVRDFQQNTLGGAAIGDWMTDVSSRVGTRYELMARDISDRFMGVERDEFTQSDLDRDVRASDLNASGGELSGNRDTIRRSMSGGSRFSKGIRSSLDEDWGAALERRDNTGWNIAKTASIAGAAFAVSPAASVAIVSGAARGYASDSGRLDRAARAGYSASIGESFSGNMTSAQRDEGIKAYEQMLRAEGKNEEANQFRRFAGRGVSDGHKVMTVKEEAKRYKGLIGDIDLPDEKIGAVMQDSDVKELLSVANQFFHAQKGGDHKTLKTLESRLQRLYSKVSSKGESYAKLAKQAIDNMGIDFTTHKDGSTSISAQRGIEMDSKQTYAGGGSYKSHKLGAAGHSSEGLMSSLDEISSSRATRTTLGMVEQSAKNVFGTTGSYVTRDGDSWGYDSAGLVEGAKSMTDSEIEDLSSTNKGLAEAIGEIKRNGGSRAATNNLIDELYKTSTIGASVTRSDGSPTGIAGEGSAAAITGVNAQQIEAMKLMVANLEALNAKQRD